MQDVDFASESEPRPPWGHDSAVHLIEALAPTQALSDLSVDRYQARNRDLSRISSDVIFLRSIFMPTNHINAAVAAMPVSRWV